jgi:hypothetical protein
MAAILLETATNQKMTAVVPDFVSSSLAGFFQNRRPRLVLLLSATAPEAPAEVATNSRRTKTTKMVNFIFKFAGLFFPSERGEADVNLSEIPDV